jgi:catechol 2,3-dioxygenase-like lactoylglutathione lyase family enzyme
MPAGFNHVALRVSDLEKSVTFYQEVFGARRLTPAFDLTGDFAEMATGGPKGTHMKVTLLSVDDGALELFEFGEPRHPSRAISPWESNLMHFAVTVDDVDVALERVLAAGGGKFWPEAIDLAEWRAIYVTDPDNNVIELLTANLDNLVSVINENFAG